MKHKFDGIDITQVLQVSKDHMLCIDGKPLTELEVSKLKEEARVLESFRIWLIMQETVKQKAVEKGFLESKDWEETLAGKMMLHNLGLLKSILEVIQKYSLPQKVIAPLKKGLQ